METTIFLKVDHTLLKSSNYENGYSTPDIFTLCKLADIFGISLDELVEWEKD